MPYSAAYIPGALAEEHFPLGRFLPALPEGVVAAWLQANVPAGAWVIDPFSASPAVVAEAARAGYRVLAAANNPIERFLLELFCQPAAIDELRSVLAELAGMPKGYERIEPYIRALYHTACPHCGALIEAQAFIWDRQSMQPVGRLLDCPQCHNPGEYPVTNFDLENAKRFSVKGLHWFRALERVAPLKDPDREFVQEAMAAYLPRSVDALFTLVNRLDHLTPPRRRLASALLLPVFDQTNTLWPYPTVKSRPKQLTLPPRFLEQNVWLAVEAAISGWERLIKEWARHSQELELRTFPQLAPPGGVTVIAGRLKELVDALQHPDAYAFKEGIKIKAILTAIPRPNQAYWSLSTLWAGWLWGSETTGGFKSVLRRRRYDWNWHCTALSKAFASLYELAPSGTPFLGLNGESEPGLLGASVLAGASAGFSLQSVALRQKSKQVQIQWKRNRPPPEVDWLPSQFQEIAARIGNQSLHEYLSQRGEPASYAQLHAVMLTEILKSSQFCLPKGLSSGEMLSVIQPALQHTTAQDPALDHLGGHERSLEAGSWFFQTEGPEAYRSPAEVVPLSDQVEMDVVRFLQEHPDCTQLAVERAICRQYPGMWTPDAELVHACLVSYAYESAARHPTWHLRDQDAPAVRRSDLEEMSMKLEKIGRDLGYRFWQSSPLQPGFRPVILWLKDQDSPTYLFYITTSAIISPLLTQVDAYLFDHPERQPQKRILVIPGGRASLIQFKIEQNPLLKNAIGRQWRFLKFRSLRRLAADTSLGAEDLDQFLSQDPVERMDPQLPLF